jgi:DNA-binding transcriptional regulator GbsR (MarR family)
MGEANGLMKGPTTSLFEKVAKWIGLSPNAGPVLAALFIEHYETGERLSSDDICDVTGYSRANAGLIVSQLEALGVIDGQRDYDQTGRGRKRVLYAVNGTFSDIFELGVISIQDRLNGMLKDLQRIENIDAGPKGSFAQLMKEVRKSVENRQEELRSISSSDISVRR